MSESPVLSVRAVRKSFARSTRGALRYGLADIVQAALGRRAPIDRLRPGEFWALRDVSFSLRRGESIGIIGRNGAGKSTLLKLISGIYAPTSGSIDVAGRIGAIIELGAAFAGNLTGRENIRPQALLGGYDEARIRRRMDDIIAFADIGTFIDAPVQHYSTGMRARLGFAVAAFSESELLAVDEALAVGDFAFQHKCLRFIEEFRARGGAVVFVGHSTHQMQAVCERGMVLHEGEVRFHGGIVDALEFYASSSDAQKVEPLSDGGALGDGGPLQVAGPCTFEIAGDATTGSTSARLRMRAHLAHAIPNLRLAATFFNQRDGLPVAGGVTEPFAVRAGERDLDVRFPELPFAPGAYLARLSAVTGDPPYPIWTRGWQDAPVPFDVPGAATAETNLFETIGVHVRVEVRMAEQGEA